MPVARRSFINANRICTKDTCYASGLRMFLNAGFVMCVYRCVVRMLEWPSNSCTYRTFTPSSNKCVAKTSDFVQHWLSEITISPFLLPPSPFVAVLLRVYGGQAANGSPGTSDQPPRYRKYSFSLLLRETPLLFSWIF